MEIISNYRDIDIEKLKTGDCFLSINPDGVSYNGYKFEKKEKSLYKFMVLLPNNASSVKSDSYCRDIFFTHNNKLFLLDSVEMKNYNPYYMEENYVEQFQRYGYGREYGIGILCDETIDFLLQERIFDCNYDLKSNYINMKISREVKENNNNRFEIFNIVFSYLSIKLENEYLLLITKYDVDNNEFSVLQGILSINEDISQISKVKNMPKKRGRKSKYELSIKEYEKLYAQQILRNKLDYLNNPAIFKNIAMFFKEKEAKKFGRLNIFLFKLSKCYTFFNNIDSIKQSLHKDYGITTKIKIEIKEIFLGYILYEVDGRTRIYDTRSCKFVYENYRDISKKYLGQDNIIMSCLNRLNRYNDNKRYRGTSKNELPPLFDDIDFDNQNILYKDNKYILVNGDLTNCWYKKFGKFVIPTMVSDEVKERYETFKKLIEAE